jgi:hypothetical protein
MSERIETIAVRCPICPDGPEHSYELVVGYSFVAMRVEHGVEPETVQRRFTRNCRCPTTSEHFEVPITVVEEPHERLRSVEVRTPHDESSDTAGDGHAG